MHAMPAVLAVLAALNVWTLLRFRHDKRCAAAGLRRVPEAELLRLALLGGSPAALIARRLFRHKTRKQPFSTYLLAIVAVQAGVALSVAISVLSA